MPDCIHSVYSLCVFICICVYLHLLLCISINRTELVYFVLACYNLTGGTVCIASSERLFGEEPSGAPTFLIYFNVPSLPFLGDQAVNCYAVYGSTPLCFLMQLVCEDGAQYKSIHAHPDRYAPMHVPGLVQIGSQLLTDTNSFFEHILIHSRCIRLSIAFE